MNDAPPEIGITLFATDRGMNPAELAREVESRGFASLYLPEHSHIPVSRRTRWPGSRPGGDDPLPDIYWHLNDQLVSLSMAAAVTERLELGTAVTLVAQHDPIWLAKQLATLDFYSGGRVVLGVGFGWNVEQAEDHGVDFRRRRQLTEDCIGVMRALWREHEASFSGRQLTLPPSWAYPKPARDGGPPVILGGGTGPVLFDAIARYGDGWMPISGRASLADRLAPLRRKWLENGRPPEDLQVIVAGATTDPRGLANLGREGVGRALLTVWEESRDAILHKLDEFAGVLQQVSGAR
jgi:probable F420-dependent oxidoreductase